jgi:hypothetical protein
MEPTDSLPVSGRYSDCAKEDFPDMHLFEAVQSRLVVSGSLYDIRFSAQIDGR